MEIKRILKRPRFIKILASSFFVYSSFPLSIPHQTEISNGHSKGLLNEPPSAILPVFILIIFSVFKAYSTFLSSNEGMIKRKKQTKNKRPPSQETYHQSEETKENKKTPTMII